MKDKIFESLRDTGNLNSETNLQQNSEFKFFQINLCKIDQSSYLDTVPSNYAKEDSEEQELNEDLDNAPVVLQITDISGKLLYSEAKA